jgi:hypothetical protein
MTTDEFIKKWGVIFCYEEQKNMGKDLDKLVNKYRKRTEQALCQAEVKHNLWQHMCKKHNNLKRRVRYHADKLYDLTNS